VELPNYPRATEIRAALIERADLIGRALGMSRGALSKSALNDYQFLPKVAAGGNFTLRSYERLMKWIDGRHRDLQRDLQELQLELQLAEREPYERQLTIVKGKDRRRGRNMRAGHDKRKTKRRARSDLTVRKVGKNTAKV